VAEVGREVYETFFRGYTRKQWQRDPSDLHRIGLRWRRPPPGRSPAGVGVGVVPVCDVGGYLRSRAPQARSSCSRPARLTPWAVSDDSSPRNTIWRRWFSDNAALAGNLIRCPPCTGSFDTNQPPGRPG
jgi:hypothetical protein